MYGRNTETATDAGRFFDAPGESHQTPFENHSVLWVVAVEKTLQTLWNAIYDKFLVIEAFL